MLLHLIFWNLIAGNGVRVMLDILVWREVMVG